MLKTVFYPIQPIWFYHGYPFKLIGTPFYYNVLGEARVLAGGGGAMVFLKGEVDDSAGFSPSS